MQMTQCEAIFDYLASGNRLTQAEAYERFGCWRLSGRIKELRKQGVKIKTDMEPNLHNGGRHGVYYMEVDNDKNCRKIKGATARAQSTQV